MRQRLVNYERELWKKGHEPRRRFCEKCGNARILRTTRPGIFWSNKRISEGGTGTGMMPKYQAPGKRFNRFFALGIIWNSVCQQNSSKQETKKKKKKKRKKNTWNSVLTDNFHAKSKIFERNIKSSIRREADLSVQQRIIFPRRCNNSIKKGSVFLFATSSINYRGSLVENTSGTDRDNNRVNFIRTTPSHLHDN